MKRLLAVISIAGLLFLPVLAQQAAQQALMSSQHIAAGGSGAAFVQQKARNNAPANSAATSLPWDLTLTAGNSTIIIISFTDAVSSSSGALNSGGAESLTRAYTSTISGNVTEVWYVHNVAGGETSATITLSGSSRYTINALEFSGLKNAGPEATNTNSALANSTVTTNSVTPSSAHNLIVASGAWSVNDYSSGPTSSFTRLTASTNLNVAQEGAYLIQSSASSQSTGWSLTAGINWCAGIAAFGAN